MSDCTECGWPVATDADNDRPCDDHCDHCRGLCWHEFTGVHRDDVRPDAAIATLTHRAEAADLWRERCNKAEQKADVLRVERDGLRVDLSNTQEALVDAQDAYDAAGYEAFQCAN